jgi:UPF0755 protein
VTEADESWARVEPAADEEERARVERDARRAEREARRIAHTSTQPGGLRRGERRQGRTGRTGGAGRRPAPPARHLAAPSGRRPTGSHRGPIVLGVALIVLAAMVGGGIAFYHYYFETGKLGAKVRVVIPSGASLTQVADILAARGVVPRARAFEIRASGEGHTTDIKAGAYVFHRNEPYRNIIDTLVRGPRSQEIRVTMPEGDTVRQMAALLHARLPGFHTKEYLTITLHKPIPVPFGVPGYDRRRGLEGLLFPATYYLLPTATPREVVTQQLTALHANLGTVDLRRAHGAHLTTYDVLIIASLIEREVHVPQERRLVAAVIWNRLRAHMLLQIDATVEYALGRHKAVLSLADLHVNSPYNTYLHRGLPPTPIANPGKAAIIAAANPAPVKYLYYVVRGDGSGRHYFATTYAEFLKDEAKANH